jgi:hypothetical protein
MDALSTVRPGTRVIVAAKIGRKESLLWQQGQEHTHQIEARHRRVHEGGAPAAVNSVLVRRKQRARWRQSVQRQLKRSKKLSLKRGRCDRVASQYS